MTIAQWLPPAVRAEPADGGPRLLDVLLAAVDTQVAALHEDLDRLRQDFFIESCQDWVVPYLGALLGLPPDANRREVAFAVALRRRKGTPAALEDFGFVVTGLTVRVLEGWQHTVWAQRFGHPPPARVAALAPRDLPAMARFGGPFETGRRVFTPGRRWHPRAATAVVWPWQIRTLSDTEAAPLADAGRFALDPLGGDAPLYLRPRRPRIASETDAGPDTRTGDEADAPVRATYDVMTALGEVTYGPAWQLPAGHPLAQDGTLLALTVGGSPVGWSAIRFGALPPGAEPPAPPGTGEVVVDPNRGHVQLGAGLSGTVRATRHRAFAGTFGAFASRADEQPGARVVVVVNPASSAAEPTLAAAFTKARTLAAALDPAGSRPGVPDVEIRLETSDRLAAPPPQTFAAAVPRWRIVAPALVTPTVVGDLQLDLAGGQVELAGFLHTGTLRLGEGLVSATLDGITQDPAAGGVNVSLNAWGLALVATRCGLGPIRADLGALPITLTDCVVDGRRRRARPCGGGAPQLPMVNAVDRVTRFAPALVTAGVTFAGPVRAESVHATDTVFADGLEVVQQQEGGVRHSYLAPPSSGPARWPATYASGPYPPPAFVSTGFGAAGYYALDYADRDDPLLTAASDGGEVGAYQRAGRAALIRRFAERIEEFTPMGLRASVVVAEWEER